MGVWILGCAYGVMVKVCWTDCAVLVPSRLFGSRLTAMLNENVNDSPIVLGNATVRKMLFALAFGAMVTSGDVTVKVSPRLPIPVTVTCAKTLLTSGLVTPIFNTSDPPEAVKEMVFLKTTSWWRIGSLTTWRV